MKFLLIYTIVNKISNNKVIYTNFTKMKIVKKNIQMYNK